MTTLTKAPYGTIRIHFSDSMRAMAASYDGSCAAGMRTMAGKVKTWIAHVPKVSPGETVEEAMSRVR